MTTTGPATAPRQGSGVAAVGELPVILRTGAVTVAVGVAFAVVGFAVAGPAAGWGVLVGVALCVGVFAFGATTLDVVARIMPAASLLVALLTYGLQVVAMALVFAALNTAGALDGPLDPQWLGAAVIGATVVWMVGQVVAATRRRIPVYELPPGAGTVGPR